MFKKILVAIDGSKTANLALKEAITLAKENKGTFVEGVHVVDAYSVTPEVEFITVEQVRDSMREEGKQLLKLAKKKMDAAGIKSEVKLLETNGKIQRLAEVISKEAQKLSADLIVVGTHGRRGFSHFLLGSVAESIVRIATKPVLLIRGK
jgi:nucleotide-binding universal stress UspA family protein